jgi:hypothetical protein
VYTVNNSKNLPLKKTPASSSINNIHFPWRDKKLKRRFHWKEFINPKLRKIVLESGSKDSKDKGKGDGSGHGKGKGKGRRRNDNEEEHNTYYTTKCQNKNPTKLKFCNECGLPQFYLLVRFLETRILQKANVTLESWSES